MIPDKPKVALYLDIDGVLGPQSFTDYHTDNIRRKVKELTKNNPHNFNRCDGCNTCSTAQAHLFNKEIVGNLNKLNKKIEAVAALHIIIPSDWRLNRSVDDLKSIFSMHEFSKYIFDKTIDTGSKFEDWKDFCVVPHDKILFENIMEHYKKPAIDITRNDIDEFILKNCECRASQINRWINDHPGYSAFVIIDDRDEHLSDNFRDKFISTGNREYSILRPEDCEKVYRSIMDQLGINI